MEKSVSFLPDTSTLVDGIISRKIRKREIVPDRIIIHEAVVAELEHLANQNRAVGLAGLQELKRIRELSDSLSIDLQFGGRRPTASEIKLASLGEIDSLIRELAHAENGTLVTSDKIQADIARAKKIDVMLVDSEKRRSSTRLDAYFDSQTMSVHLKEKCAPSAKKGVPGNWRFCQIRDGKLSREDIQGLAQEIIEATSVSSNGFVEIEKTGSTIIQLGQYRIVMTRPPLSDGWEITAVRPVRHLSLADYTLSEKLLSRISEKAEGILIGGSPGMGKSTFAQALAEYYAEKSKIVKTIEAPRDLVLPDSVTQYAISHADSEEIHDVLLLSRPDYTIFDEMRNTRDFQLYSDLRLAGIGLAGVVHATNPIDAIQRFVGRIDLGVIPQVIDTVIFIKDGRVSKALGLAITVKVPSGMTEADLARPVVVVTDFETNRLEYELYSYGEETVVVPVATGKSPSMKLAEKSVEATMHKFSDTASVDMISENKCIVRVPEENIAKIIGKQGRTIAGLEENLGLSIDIQPLPETAAGEGIEFETKITKDSIKFCLDSRMKNQDIDMFIGEDYLLTAKAGKSSVIRVNRNNKIGKIISDAIEKDESIRLTAK
ncbi:MAG: PINc/VapC family ATPase [archaeon]